MMKFNETSPSELKKSFQDSRLEIVFRSPRLFLKENASPGNSSQKKFDLVIVNTPDPSNLIINNLFTQEFYSLLKENLKDRGVLGTRITSAENYIG